MRIDRRKTSSKSICMVVIRPLLVAAALLLSTGAGANAEDDELPAISRTNTGGLLLKVQEGSDVQIQESGKEPVSLIDLGPDVERVRKDVDDQAGAITDVNTAIVQLANIVTTSNGGSGNSGGGGGVVGFIAVQPAPGSCVDGGVCRSGGDEAIQVVLPSGHAALGVPNAYGCTFTLPDGTPIKSDRTTATQFGGGYVVECTFPKAAAESITQAAWVTTVGLEEFGRDIPFVGVEGWKTISFKVEGPTIGNIDDQSYVLPEDKSREVTIEFTVDDQGRLGELTVSAVVQPEAGLEPGTHATIGGVDGDRTVHFTPKQSAFDNGEVFTVTITATDHLEHEDRQAVREFTVGVEAPEQSKPTSCKDVWNADPTLPSGPYAISPGDGSVTRTIFCDMSDRKDHLGRSLGAGWWVIQSNGWAAGREFKNNKPADVDFYTRYVDQRWNDGSGDKVQFAWGVEQSSSGDYCSFVTVSFDNTYQEFKDQCRPEGDNPDLVATWQIYAPGYPSDKLYDGYPNSQPGIVRCQEFGDIHGDDPETDWNGLHIKRMNNGEHSPLWKKAGGVSNGRGGYMVGGEPKCGSKDSIQIW